MLGDIMVAVVRRGLAAATNLAATSYLAHQFGSGQMGSYIGMLALGQLLNVALVFGLDLTPAYLLRSQPENSRRVWRVATIASLALAAICLSLWLVSGIVAAFLGNTGTELLAWGGYPFVYACGLVLMLPQMSCLQGLLRLHAFNILQVLYPASFLLGLIAMDHFHGPLTPSSALVLLSTLSMLAGLCAAFLVVNCLRVRHPRIGTHSADRSIRKLFLGYSLGSYAANLLGSLNSRLPGLLAALTLAPTAAGVFAGLVILSDLFAFFSHAIASVTFPKLAGRSDPDGRLRDLQLACRINTTTTLAAIVIFGLMFDHVVSLILGSSYVGQQQFGWMSMVVLACSVPHSTARLLCTDFASQGSPQLNAWLNIPPMLLFISVFIVTAETWQTWGTVAAFASSTLLFSAFVFLAHQRRSGIVLRNIAILLPSDIRMVADRLRSPV